MSQNASLSGGRIRISSLLYTTLCTHFGYYEKIEKWRKGGLRVFERSTIIGKVR